MNMALGCRERVGKEWFYYLKDGTKLTKEEWTSIVNQRIKEYGHEEIIEKKKATVNKLWNNKESAYDVALYVYEGQYCKDVVVARRVAVPIKQVKDDMGCTQLAFC